MSTVGYQRKTISKEISFIKANNLKQNLTINNNRFNRQFMISKIMMQGISIGFNYMPKNNFKLPKIRNLLKKLDKILANTDLFPLNLNTMMICPQIRIKLSIIIWCLIRLDRAKEKGIVIRLNTKII